MNERVSWSFNAHESKVEKFYGSGIEGFHEFHNGYLNFGLWTRSGMSYVEAAENLVQHLGEKLGLDKHSVLLDTGCGMGTQDVFLTQNFSPTRIDALDVTWKHVERARQRAKQAGIDSSRLEFHHGTATRLPFSDNTFTHVLAIESPEHMDTREDFFKEAYRVLKPGGVIVCSDYSLARSPKNFVEQFIVESARRLWQVPKANVYGNTVFQTKLNAAGFRNITIENMGAQVIPGYYFNQCAPETVAEVRRVRGFLKGVIGGYLIDRGVYSAYRRGLCEYIVLRAQKSS